MAIQHRATDERLAPAYTFLAERGVLPNHDGEFGEEQIPEIEAAIRERGWPPMLVEEDGEWVVNLADQRPGGTMLTGVAAGPDRVTALLQTLRRVITWLTPEEEVALFDKEAQFLLGMSGDEFLRRWEAGELSTDDSAVVHLLMQRPRGR